MALFSWMRKKPSKILLIDGHPEEASFCQSLALAYQQGAIEGKCEIRRINLRDLKFDLVLRTETRSIENLENDLKIAQEHLIWCDHIVFVFPTWWVGPPALLKGFIDRIFLRDFAFRRRENSRLCDGLLKGKTARIITTMGAPLWYNWLAYRSEGHISLRRGTLNFCGIRPVKSTPIASIFALSDKKREKWLQKIHSMGRNRL